VQDVLHQELAIGLAITSLQPMTSGDITRLLEKSHLGNVAIRDFSWANPNGLVLHSSNPVMTGADVSHRACFRSIVAGQEWIVSELVISRTTGKPIFSISRGIRDDKGHLLGLIIATVLPERLGAVLSVERAKGGGISIVDNKGMLVYRYPAVDVTWEERDRLKIFPQWKEALDGNEVTAIIPGSYDGDKKRIVASTPIASIGWGAGAGSTEEEAMEAITSRLLPQAILFLLVTLAAFGTALILSRSISTPVKRLRDHALSLGQGETHKPAVATGPAELRELADSFNVMVEELRSRETSLNEQREALRRSEAQLRTTLENLTQGVAIANLEGDFLYWNRACLEMHGYASQEECQRRLPEFTHTFELSTMEGEILPLEQWPLSRILRGETLRDWEVHVRHLREGWQRIFLYGGTIARDTEGKPVVALTSVRDITARNQMEEELRKARDELELRVEERTAELVKAGETLREQAAKLEQSNQALQEFAYIASHDLQEPLRTVSCFVQLLERRYRGKLDADADEFIFHVVDGARRMQSLINDLLMYSRVDTQGNPFESTAMETIFRETISSLQGGIDESGAIIIHDPLPTLPVDPAQMARLLQNLIGNALKFQSQKPPEIHISAEQWNGEWLFSVKDNGIGIDSKFSKRIFKIFQRLHTKEEYPGTGIGLAVCKKIVERHGGRIWVESERGEGSTFYFTVPARLG